MLLLLAAKNVAELLSSPAPAAMPAMNGVAIPPVATHAATTARAANNPTPADNNFGCCRAKVIKEVLAGTLGAD